MISVTAWLKAVPLGLLALVATGSTRSWAQPANDNFASAEVISGSWGMATNDNSTATGEFGEPSHAGSLATHSIWYQFIAPLDGEVALDTYGSALGLDTVLAVYTGATLPTLNQVAANDDLYASLRYNGQTFVQFNESAQNTFILDQTDPANQIFSASAGLFLYNQPFTGPSGLRFNAAAGTTYYIALDSKVSAGPTTLTWAYHSSGVFRFASENVDQSGIRDTNGKHMLLYTCAETEGRTRSFNGSRGISLPNGSGLTYNTTFHTYYNYDVPGLMVAVTRVAGSSGRVAVDYTTMDVDNNLLINGDHLPNGDHLAVAGSDYFPVSGRLTFDDFEMSKTILIPIGDDFLTPQLNRDFIIAITNVALDTAESAEVSPPRADPTYYQALVRILDVDIDPRGPTRNDIVFTNIVITVDTNGVSITNSISVTNINYQLDFPTNGVFNFEKVHYRVPRDATNYWGAWGAGTPITVYVRRDGTNQASSTINWRINNYFLSKSAAGDNANIYFPLEPGSDYATPNPPNQAAVAGRNPDFDFPNGYSGTLTFPGGNDVAAQPISFTVFDNGSNQFSEDFHIELYDLDSKGNPIQVGNVAETTVTILFDDLHPPAGSVDEYYNADHGIDMVPPANTTLAHPGTDGEVDAVAVQSDDKAIFAGHFGSFNGLTANGIARAETNGLPDATFDAGDGIFSQGGDFISSIVLQPDGKIIVGGSFPAFAGVLRNGIARLNSDGSLDRTFDPGTGADGVVWAVALQTDGKVLIAGDFTSFNGTARVRVARLNADGSLDTTFDPGANAPNAAVNAIALTSAGRVVIGGDFTQLGSVAINRLARLFANGTRDVFFNPGAGVDGPVYALAAQPDGNLLVGGEFLHYNTAFNFRRLVRVTSSGLVDTNFIPGIGADGTVYNIDLQNNGTIYIGGSFTSFNGTHRLGFARLYADGTVDTSFLDTAYNQFAGLPRRYFGDTPGTVLSSAVQSDGNVMIGGSFDQVGGGQFSPLVRPESLDTNNHAIESALLYIPEPKVREGIRNRNNIARLIGGGTPGPGNITLANSAYSANESQSSLYVSLIRTNGALGPASANFSVLPGIPGQAQSGVDYFYNSPNPLYWITWEFFGPTRMHSDGLFGTNTIMQDVYGGFVSYGNNGPSSVIVSVSQNPTNRGDLSASFQLANPPGADQFYLGGQNIPLGVALGRSSAPFKLIDDLRKSGVFGFALPSFTGSTNSATVSVSRTNGTYGTVQMNFATSNGTAVAGVDYQATNGLLSFLDGQTNRTFPVRILQSNYTSQVEKTIILSLFNLNGPSGGGASFGLSNSIVRIINPNFQGYLNFSATNYGANLSAGSMVIIVTRTVGSLGTLSVQCVTSNGTAINGLDYVGSTNTLTWNSGDVSIRTLTIPLINNGVVGGTKQFFAMLRNPTLNGASTPSLLGAAANATLTITNDNSYGTFQFSAPSYIVNENGGYATITVTRTGGANQGVTVNYTTVPGTALAGVNYVTTSGSLAFTNGELAKSFNVPILDDGSGDPPLYSFFFSVNLTTSTPLGVFGFQTNAPVYIRDATYNQPPGSSDVTLNPATGMNDDVLTLAVQSDGRIVAGGNFTTANSVPRNHVARLNNDGTLDVDFLSGVAGANGPVNSLLVQSDNRIVIGGSFTLVNAVHRNFIARLTTDGTLDTSFNPGGGADNPVYAVAQDVISGTRKIYLGGAFNNYNGVSRLFVARLNNDGTLDGAFIVPGVDGAVFAIATYPTNSIFAGKVLIAGDFVHVNGAPRNGLARLNADGTLDPSFNPGTGASGTVRALAIQLDGRVLLGGAFTNVNGVVLNHIARLNADGSMDPVFVAGVGVGASDTVDAIMLQPDNRIVLGGLFTQANGVTRSRITRLMPDGSVDPTINFGAGANNFVAALALQAEGQIVLGGGFTTYNDEPHAHIARIYGGAMVGSGNFEFTSGTYQVDEISSNAVITVRRVGGTSGPNPDGSGNVTVDFNTSNGTAVAGVNYSAVSTTLIFPVGEVVQTVTIPVFDDQVVTPDLTVNLALSNATGGAGIGNQPTATLTIINDDSTISFSSAIYSVNKNNPFGLANIDILRQGSTNGAVTVVFMTTTNGTAVIGTDYLAVSNLVTFNPGVSNVSVAIPIINNSLPEGNRTVTLLLTNATSVVSNLVNLLLVPPAEATLTIIDTVQAPGQVMFSATNYVFTEGNSNAIITVIRTNGSSGTISVNYLTVPGTAVPGLNYTTVSGTITFGNGETVKTFAVPLLENSIAQGPVTLSLILSNATGGATLLAPTNVPMTILDNDTGIAFSSAAYVVNETNGSVTLNVLRLNSTAGTVQVNYATTNGTALAGVNYTAISGVLTFNPGVAIQSITVPVLHDPRATSNLTFAVNLSNPTAGAQLMFPSSASVIVLDAEAGLSFTSPTFGVLKNGTNAVLTVFCSNPNVEPVSVNFASADDTAVAGIDYTAVNGILTFTNSMVTNYIVVPIINNSLVEGDRTFTVSLSSPTSPGQLVAPSTASVTITDINAGFSFSSPAYTVLSGNSASIGIVRTGYTNSTASVTFFTQDGSATSGDYTSVNTNLVFASGQTSTNINVATTFDSTIVKPDRTVLLQLSNPVGTNAFVVSPSAAVLTIHDTNGSLVVPAGATLLSESGPVNGIIDPGETVSLLFGLRNNGGTNTANLVATLLATNGVTLPSGAQNYGALINNGPSASRQFSFTASGTNGQSIVATFRLQDGAANVGTAMFTFTLGTSANSFTNNATIVINDNTNASPYPSTITVSGVGGSLSKATVTFNQLYHTWSSDVDALLVSPSGQKTLLMANAGGSFTMNNVTLTFDDAASNFLPQGSQITSGTNKPTTYYPVAVFPSPAPAAPYATNLASFNGSNPNGVWSLYVIDDSPGNVGIISNGWSMNLTIANLVGSTADLVAGMTASPSPVVVNNSLTYTMTVTNYGPSTATGVTLTDTLPGSVTLLSSNATQGTVSAIAGQITWNAGTLAINAGATLTIAVRPNAAGSIINTCFVSANETDPNFNNNAATVATPVNSATADLILSLVDAPDPVWLGNNVTYTLTVTNAGPATATGVTITDTLPPTVVVISATPGGYTVSSGVLTFTNLGSIISGAQAVATIVVKTTVGGTITNSALVTSQVTDPLKANNSASVKTVVETLLLSVARSGNNLVITWPTNTPGNVVLESATNLNPPAVWTAVTSPLPVVSNGQYVITIPIGSGSQYFRLHGP
jgi:uncharacterized delta-60 repeat protein/uncharacterized repeat protein (TIGR01451 family)